MLIVKLVTVLTIAVLSMLPDLVKLARIGTVSHQTDMAGAEEELETIIIVGIQIMSPMYGVIPRLPTRDGSFVMLEPALDVTKRNLRKIQTFRRCLRKYLRIEEFFCHFTTFFKHY